MIDFRWAWPCSVSLALATGCAPAEPRTRPAAGPPKQPLAAPKQPAAPAAAPSAASPPADSTASPVSSRQAAQPPATPQAAPREMRRAAPGLSGRGNRYGGDPLTAPLSARFHIEERLELQSVTYALKLFQAEQGRLPKSHEEFMEKIIQANNITLPPLPPGETYQYDPQQGQLMVRKAR